LVSAQRGFNGGTWAHPKLAVFFARWLNATGVAGRALRRVV